MASTASITIVVDDSQATQAFKNINAESAQAMGTMTAGAGNASKALDGVTPALGRIGRANREGREAAVLLTEELGVRMPRALANVLSDTKVIGPALQTAFSGVAIGAFIGLGVELVDTLAKVIDKTMGWSEQIKKTKEEQDALTRIVVDGAQTLQRLQEEYQLIGLTGLPRLSKEQQLANEKFKEANTNVEKLYENLHKLQQLSQEKKPGQLVFTGSSAIPGPEVPTADALKAQAGIADAIKKITDAEVEVENLRQKVMSAGKAFDSSLAEKQAENIKK